MGDCNCQILTSPKVQTDCDQIYNANLSLVRSSSNLSQTQLLLYQLDIGSSVYHFLQYIYIPTRYTM